MTQISITGAEGIAALAAAVRRLGDDRTIVNHMSREIRDWGKLVVEDARANAIRRFGKRGGLAFWVYCAGYRIRILRGQRRAGVSVVVGRNGQQKRAYLRGVDVTGIVRSPLFGDREHWHETRFKAGWVTDAGEANRDEFMQRIDTAIARAFREVFTVGRY